MQGHDPHADYIQSELKKIDDILTRMKHHVMGKSQHDAEAAQPVWMFANAAQSQQASKPAAVVASPRIQHHLDMINAMQLAGNRATVAVVEGGSFFKTSAHRWIFRTSLIVALLAFIAFAYWISILIRRTVYFH